MLMIHLKRLFISVPDELTDAKEYASALTTALGQQGDAPDFLTYRVLKVSLTLFA